MTKEKILDLFETNKGKILSGEEIATYLGISRTAIWKGINLLREEGYDIEAIRKKGYRLNPNSDILSLVKIQSHLSMPTDEVHLEIYKKIDSTNKRIKELALQDASQWTVVASEMQTKGKGRAQRVFLSPEGKGIYMSVLLRPNIKWESRELYLAQIYKSVKDVITLLTAQVVTQVNGSDFCIGGKKVAGVLTELSVEAESQIIESIVVGIGINIYDQRQLGCEDEIQIALSDITGDYCNRSEVIATLLNHLYQNII